MACLVPNSDKTQNQLAVSATTPFILLHLSADPLSPRAPQTCVADALKQAESLAAENVELRRMGEDALLDKCAVARVRVLQRNSNSMLAITSHTLAPVTL